MSTVELANGSSKHSSPNKLKAKRPSKRLQELRRSGGDIGSYNYRRPANGARPDSVDVDSVYEDDTSDLMTRFTINARRYTHKNSHRPRGRYGRGLPKKNGAGGNFTWGIAGSEFAGQPNINGADPAIDNTDPLDPNYDSDSEDNCKLEAITPPMEEHEIENYVKPIIIEYFEHCDSSEVAFLLEEVNLFKNYHQILVITISLAMDRKSSHRELASNLVSDLFGRILTMEEFEQGFDILIAQLPELELDTPDAATILGNFIARAVADDCVAPKYVYQHREKLLSDEQADRGSKAYVLARKAFSHAHALITKKGGLVQLDTVWGIAGGARPVKYLIKQIRLLLKEYMISMDHNETVRGLRELEVPHFYHEFVYEAVLMAIEGNNKPHEHSALAQLLKSMSDINLLSVDQMKKGFLRIFDEISEINIDVPLAYQYLEKFLQECFSKKVFLPREVLDNVPSKGRKRFVSEGDGGRIKE